MIDTAQHPDLPVACALTEPALQDRAEELRQTLFSTIQAIRDLPDGRAVQFPGNDDSLATIAEFIRFERACCPFLTFELHCAPAQGPLWLHLRGPEGTSEFLSSLLPVEDESVSRLVSSAQAPGLPGSHRCGAAK